MTNVVATEKHGQTIIEVVKHEPPDGSPSGIVYSIQRRIRREDGRVNRPMRYGEEDFQSIEAASAGGREWIGVPR